MQSITGKSLLAGDAEGKLVFTEEPLSFWGGFDAQTGNIIDTRHGLNGFNVSGKVLALPYSRGSSTGSGLLLEGIRTGTAPCALILSRPDAILALGAIVARELYAKLMPIVLVSENDFTVLRSVHWVKIEPSGAILWG